MIPRSTGTDSTNSCSDQQTGDLHSFIPGLLCNAQKMCFRSYLHTNTCIHIQFLAYFLVLLPYLATSVALPCLVFPHCALESLQCQGLNPGFLQPNSQIRPQHHPPHSTLHQFNPNAAGTEVLQPLLSSCNHRHAFNPGNVHGASGVLHSPLGWGGVCEFLAEVILIHSQNVPQPTAPGSLILVKSEVLFSTN